METVKLLEKTIMIIRMKLRELRRRDQSLRIEVDNIDQEAQTIQNIIQSFKVLNPGVFENPADTSAIEHSNLMQLADIDHSASEDDQIVPVFNETTSNIASSLEPRRDIQLVTPVQRRKRTRTRFSTEESELIFRLRAEGVALSEIGRIVNRTAEQVRYHWRYHQQLRTPRDEND